MIISKRLAALAFKRKELMKKLNDMDEDSDKYSEAIKDIKNMEMLMRPAYKDNQSEMSYGLAYGASALPVEDE